MLTERGVDFRYRDYKKDPLTEAEIRDVLGRLGVAAHQVLRRRDRAFREQGLSGDEPEGRLISLMAAHPTLLERPIGVYGESAVIGRPIEKLLSLLPGDDT